MLNNKIDYFQFYYGRNDRNQLYIIMHDDISVTEFNKNSNDYTKTSSLLDTYLCESYKSTKPIANIHDALADIRRLIQYGTEFQYDLHTLEAIYRRRIQCSHYNPLYAKQIIKNYVSNINYKNIIDRNTLLLHLFKYIYLNQSVDIDKEILNNRIILNGDFSQRVIDKFVKRYPISQMYA